MSKFTDFIKNNKTSIMTYGGVGLLVGAVVSTVYSTLKAKEDIDFERSVEKSKDVNFIDFTFKKKVKMEWKKYVLPASLTLLGSTLIVKAHKVDKLTNAELAEASVVAQSMYRTLQASSNAFKETVQEKVEGKLFDEINAETNAKIAKSIDTRSEDNVQYVCDKNNPNGVKFIEPVTNQVFFAEPSYVKKVCADLCYDASHNNSWFVIPFNEVLTKFGLRAMDTSYMDAAFDCDQNGMLSISWEYVNDENGFPCGLINYNMPLKLGLDY